MHMPRSQASQKSDGTRSSLPGIWRASLVTVLLGIAVFSLGFWSEKNGPGRGVSAIRMRVRDVPAPAPVDIMLSVQSGPLYVPSLAAPAARPMSLDRTQYRAALRDFTPEYKAGSAYEPLPADAIIAFADGEVGLRTSAGLLPVSGNSDSLADAFTANSLTRALLPGIPLADGFSAFPSRNYSSLEADHYETALGGVCRIPSPYMTAFGFDEQRFIIDLSPANGRMRLRADKYRDFVASAAQRFGLSQDLIFGIMRTESAFNPFAVSNTGALGLMQLMPGTAGGEVHRFLGKESEFSGSLLFDPAYNIQYGSAYLHILFTRYFHGVKDANSRQLCVIAAYNGGPGAVLRVFDAGRDRAVEIINEMGPDEVYRKLTTEMPYEESRRYVDKVLGHMRADYSS